jgi:septal ring factor EnvC (AmiA/AmiB activator)
MFKAPIFFLLLLTVAIVHSQSQNESEKDLENKLENIQSKLKILKNKLNKAYGKESVLIEQLELQDKNIAEVSKQVKISESQLQGIQNQVKETEESIQKSNDSIEKQKSQIIELLKIQVYLNQDKTLKMLLVSPSNHNSVQTKHQIKYLQNRLFNLIKEVAHEIQSLKKSKSELLILQEQENLKQQKLLSQQDLLLDEKRQRLKILNQLKVEIAQHETESESLNKDQQRLQSLIGEIQLLLSDLPKDLGSNKPFNKLQGKMKKPVSGTYVRSFHSRRSEDTRWDGVVIQADMGAKVRSIAYGRVAFADWLRGFGLLVILDHQDGYMSLYGFNESLSVEVGDWVDERQEIATIGNSGTLAMPAVYFEVRKDAVPLNPKLWVK